MNSVYVYSIIDALYNKYGTLLKMDYEVYNQCEQEIRGYLKRFQGTRLNHMPQFKNRIPNIETICEVLYKGIDEILKQKNVKLEKVELGDNPLSTYSVGHELLVGSIYRRISEEEYNAYLKEIEGK